MKKSSKAAMSRSAALSGGRRIAGGGLITLGRKTGAL